MYLITDGYRDYENYCSQYIPKLESYYKKHHSFPNSLDIFEKSRFDFRYSNKKCGYEEDKNKFTFFMSDGFMGVIGYDSIERKWWYD